MFLRVHGFGASRAADFPTTTLAGELFGDLNGIIQEINGYMTAQASGQSASLESTGSKSAARDELRRDLEAISRTARVMARSVPGIEDKFRAPRSISDQALLAMARAFAADALPLKQEFIRRGLPDDFLEDLAADIEAFERAVNQKIRKREAQVAATAGLDDAIERGVDIVRELDAIMRNKLASDPASLAAWLSASHIERTPRRAARSSSSPDTQPPAPAS
jgi:hypothetical protein